MVAQRRPARDNAVVLDALCRILLSSTKPLRDYADATPCERRKMLSQCSSAFAAAAGVLGLALARHFGSIGSTTSSQRWRWMSAQLISDAA